MIQPIVSRLRRSGMARLSLMAAICLGAALLIQQTAVQPAEARLTITEDTSSQIRWSGWWVTRQDARASGGTEHAVEGAGATATYTYLGGNFTVYYTQAPNRGMLDVTIDNQSRPRIDQYGPLTYQKSVTFSVPRGQHTIVLTNAGSRSPGSTGWWAGVDAIGFDDATSATPTATTAPTSTRTPTATATSTRPPTAATATPTRTATPTAGQPAPVAGQPCPAWYHDRITTAGPDGKQYPTWHPAVDPASGCRFGHEHGDDPRTSRADSSMPAFGYIGLLVGDAEPHPGFKVFVQNAGTVNFDGRTIAHHSRMVFHMGTAGPKRFTTRFHSLEYDFIQVGADGNGGGHEVHVMGMGDTGNVGSICANPRQGKTVVHLPGVCAQDSQSHYEIWEVKLTVGLAEVHASFAAFDPITILDPADPTRTLLAATYYPHLGASQAGCNREAYSGPVYYYNPTGPTTFRTDAYGVPSATGPLAQYVSQHKDLGVKMTTDQTQFQAKLGSNTCAPGVQAPN